MLREPTLGGCVLIVVEGGACGMNMQHQTAIKHCVALGTTTGDSAAAAVQIMAEHRPKKSSTKHAPRNPDTHGTWPRCALIPDFSQ